MDVNVMSGDDIHLALWHIAGLWHQSFDEPDEDR
jgi:hypothetical protein